MTCTLPLPMSFLSCATFRCLHILPSCPSGYAHIPYILITDQPAESVTRFKQWFWAVVEKMTNEEKHDLVRQRVLISGGWRACSIRLYSGKLTLILAKLETVVLTTVSSFTCAPNTAFILQLLGMFGIVDVLM